MLLGFIASVPVSHCNSEMGHSPWDVREPTAVSLTFFSQQRPRTPRFLAPSHLSFALPFLLI